MGLIRTLNFELINDTGYTTFFSHVGTVFEVVWPAIRAMAIKYGLDPQYIVRVLNSEKGEWVEAPPQMRNVEENVEVSIWLYPYFCWRKKMSFT
jgi:hypothetical protein